MYKKNVTFLLNAIFNELDDNYNESISLFIMNNTKLNFKVSKDSEDNYFEVFCSQNRFCSIFPSFKLNLKKVPDLVKNYNYLLKFNYCIAVYKIIFLFTKNRTIFS